MLNRLNFINYLHDECSVPEAVETKVSYGTANAQRLWPFTKSITKKNTTHLKANTFGFYAIKCNNVVDFKENSKKEAVAEFLHQIRESNPKGRILTQQKTLGFLHALRSSASWQRNEVSHASCSWAPILGQKKSKIFNSFR